MFSLKQLNQGERSKNKGEIKEKYKNNPFEKKITYINASKEDLKALNFSDWRISLTEFMKSRPVEVLIIILIILYTLFVIVFLAIDDLIYSNKGVRLTLQVIELLFLFLF